MRGCWDELGFQLCQPRAQQQNGAGVACQTLLAKHQTVVLFGMLPAGPVALRSEAGAAEAICQHLSVSGLFSA